MGNIQISEILISEIYIYVFDMHILIYILPDIYDIFGNIPNYFCANIYFFVNMQNIRYIWSSALHLNVKLVCAITLHFNIKLVFQQLDKCVCIL